MPIKLNTRRDFLKKTSLLASLFPSYSLFSRYKKIYTNKDFKPLSVNIFSKHLQFLDYQTTGQMAAEMGFDGLDLTVRPKGHVLPEDIAIGLPKAISEIKRGGSNCEMITTSIENVNRPLDVDIIKTAANAGIKYYRTGWFKYPKDQSMIDALDMYRRQIDELGILNKENKIIGCYQNHSGKKVGASFWEIQKILETVHPDFFGAQYDIRHAIAEGGNSWENGLQLLQSKIKVIVLKDFKWGKVNGKWKPINVPIGEGMVDFDRYFKLLKKYNLNPPVSLHLEYDLGGAEKGKSKITVDKKVVFDAMKKDLKAIQKLWKDA
ncbi:MAG: sugar phosphate isomerase/epimerase family protein [Saprospiraceae bacterium]